MNWIMHDVSSTTHIIKPINISRTDTNQAERRVYLKDQ